MAAKKKQVGGRRPGAGRKPLDPASGAKGKTFQIRLTHLDWTRIQWIAKRRGFGGGARGGVAKYVRSLIDADYRRHAAKLGKPPSR